MSMLVILLETTGIKLMVCNGWILDGSYHTAGQYYEIWTMRDGTV